MEEEFYFCENGHYSDKISESGCCRECIKEQNEYQIDQKHVSFRTAKTAPLDRKKRLDNQKDDFRLYLRNAARTERHHRRRAVYHPDGMGHNEIFTHEEVLKLLQDQDNQCVGCFVSFDSVAFETDHIIPLVVGGSNTIENIQLLCRSCNTSKSNKSNESWLSEMRYRQVVEILKEIEEEESYAT